MCPHCRAFITTDDRVCPYCNTPVGPRAVDRRQPADLMGGLIPHARFTTTVLLLINGGLYIAMVLSSMNSGHGGITGLDGQIAVRVVEFSHGIKLRPHAAVLSIDYVYRGNADMDERNVIVDDSRIVLEEILAVTELAGCLCDDVL